MAEAAPPRLAVVAVIDQFPRAYLDRFESLFGEDGFRRVMHGGADFSRCRHGQAVTYTAVGHAALMTGAYPVHNGVIGNWWYLPSSGRVVAAVEDSRYPLVGAGAGVSRSGPASGVSPLFLLVPALGDALRGATGMKARVLSLSLKDRAAVLAGGRRPNAAYWFEAETCRFVTSTYYEPRLPPWLAEFNGAHLCARYVNAQWKRLRPDLDYTRFADRDDAPYERDAFGLGRTFPHPVVLAEMPKESWPPAGASYPRRYGAVAATPFGNALLLRLAETAIQAEQLGADGVPDLLVLSFSSNDLIGHLYGPDSQEVMDTVLRTDRIIAELMKFLDRTVGAGRWFLAVTSDHGVAPVPERLEALGRLPHRKDHYRFSVARARAEVERALARRFFGTGLAPAGFPGFVAAWDFTDPFIFLNRDAVRYLPAGFETEYVLEATVRAIERLDGVERVYRRAELGSLAKSRAELDRAAYRSWNAQRGGDLLVRHPRYWLSGDPRTAANHGSPYEYDTHVPMMLYGVGVRPGRYRRPVAAVDLASTLARILGIPPPSGNEGRPLIEALAQTSAVTGH